MLCASTNEARQQAADEMVEATGAHFVHPSNDPNVMSGQGTVALELLDQVKHEHGVMLDALIVPIGGAGLCSGVAMAAKVCRVANHDKASCLVLTVMTLSAVCPAWHQSFCSGAPRSS